MHSSTVDTDAGWACIGCGETDLTKLHVNLGGFYTTGDYVCSNCGFVYPELDVAAMAALGAKQPLTAEQLENETPDFRKRPFKDSYLRRVHLHERFRAANRIAPAIPDKDMDLIKGFHKLLLEKGYFYRQFFTSKTAGKRDIQQLLR